MFRFIRDVSNSRTSVHVVFIDYLLARTLTLRFTKFANISVKVSGILSNGRKSLQSVSHFRTKLFVNKDFIKKEIEKYKIWAL